MAVLAGIDEAGYGPLLGPLLATVTVFDVPNSVSNNSLWPILSSSISPGPAKRSGRIAVADSKKLFSRAGGLIHLERTALTFLNLLGRSTNTLPNLLCSLRADCLEHMNDYPWYRQQSIDLPLAADPTDLGICVNALRLDTKRNGIGFLGARCQALLVGQYNELVDKTRNKAAVLSNLTGKFLADLVRLYAGKGLVIFIDKQGGRMHYRPWLQRSFSSWKLQILREDQQASIYEMTSGRLTWHVHFEAKAESKHLPVALASIYAKYVRELFMELLNRYWAKQVPGVKPTAGYYSDGRRFLSDIEQHCKRLKTPMGKLIRVR